MGTDPPKLPSTPSETPLVTETPDVSRSLSVLELSDHRLEAAKLRAQLATVLISATGTIIAASLALGAFVAVRFIIPTEAVTLWILGLSCFFGSALSGGAGILDVSRRGANGDWSSQTPQSRYSMQATALIAAVVFVSVGFAAVFRAGRPEKVSVNSSLISYLRVIEQLQAETSGKASSPQRHHP